MVVKIASISAAVNVAVRRDHQLGEACARATGHQPNVIGNFVERDREGAKCAGELDESIMSALHREFVGSADERQVRKLFNFSSGRLAESWGCIDARSHCRTAKR